MPVFNELFDSNMCFSIQSGTLSFATVRLFYGNCGYEFEPGESARCEYY